MYELIILGFLMGSNTHGYRISKIINDMIGPYAKFSSGRLYPLFEKLAREGFISIVQNDEEKDKKGKSRQNEYQITENGKLRFHQLMMDTTTNLGEYRKLFPYKFIFIDYLQPAEKLYLVDHFINYCQTHIFHINSELEDLKLHHSELSKPIFIMEHIVLQWQLEFQWGNGIREQLLKGEI